MIYKVFINKKDYSTYLQYPISLSITLDESLDVGTIVLENTDKADTFKPYDLVTLEVYDNYNNVNTYTMFVESDDVIERLVNGNRIVYNHNITLIELTKILENHIVPNFSITNNRLFSGIKQVEPILSTLAKDGRDETVSDLYYISSKNWYLYFRCSFEVPAFTFRNEYQDHYLNDFITLNFVKEFDIVVRDLRWSEKHYHLPDYHVWQDTLLTKLDVTGDVINTKLKIMITDPDGIVEYKSYGSEYRLDKKGRYIIKYVLEAQNIPVKPITEYERDKLVNDPRDVNTTREVRTFTISEMSATHYIDVVDDVDSNLYNLRDAINKAIQTFSPVYSIGMVGNTNQVYHINKDLDSKVNLRAYSPEIEFIGGRTLKEVLSIIGKEFNGIPRLVYNNNRLELDYDIIQRDPNKFIDLPYFKNYALTSTNYFNGIITSVDNLIAEKDVIKYPQTFNSSDPIGTSINVRALNGIATANIENMGIVLPSPIDRLLKVIVSNFNPNDINDYVDITNYIVEETVFNTLTSTERNKGKNITLFYKRGSNTIGNIGYIPEAVGLAGWLGFDETTPVIDRILKSLGKQVNGYTTDRDDNIVLNNPKNYAYNIEYVPLTKADLNIQQENQYGFDAIYNTPYNADSNKIDTLLIGNETQRQLKALSNKETNTSFKTSKLADIPNVGDNTDINGKTNYINVLNVNYGFNIDVSLSFTQDWNKVADRIGISSDYQPWAISLDNIVERNVPIDRVLTFTDYDNGNSSYLDLDFYLNVLNGTHSDSYTPDHFVLQPLQDITRLTTGKHNLLTYTDNDVTKVIDPTLLPITRLHINNSIVLTSVAEDNFSIGASNDMSNSQPSVSGSFYINAYNRYVDDLGRLPAARIQLCKRTDYKYSNIIENMNNYPKAYISVLNDGNLNTVPNSILDTRIYINKDQRERIRLTHTISAISKSENVHIGSGALSNLFSTSIRDEDKGNKLILVRLKRHISLSETIRDEDYDVIDGDVNIIRHANGYKLSLTLPNDLNGSKYGYVIKYANRDETILRLDYSKVEDKVIYIRYDELHDEYELNRIISGRDDR